MPDEAFGRICVLLMFLHLISRDAQRDNRRGNCIDGSWVGPFLDRQR